MFCSIMSPLTSAGIEERDGVSLAFVRDMSGQKSAAASDQTNVMKNTIDQGDANDARIEILSEVLKVLGYAPDVVASTVVEFQEQEFWSEADFFNFAFEKAATIDSNEISQGVVWISLFAAAQFFISNKTIKGSVLTSQDLKIPCTENLREEVKCLYEILSKEKGDDRMFERVNIPSMTDKRLFANQFRDRGGYYRKSAATYYQKFSREIDSRLVRAAFRVLVKAGCQLHPASSRSAFV